MNRDDKPESRAEAAQLLKDDKAYIAEDKGEDVADEWESELPACYMCAQKISEDRHVSSTVSEFKCCCIECRDQMEDEILEEEEDYEAIKNSLDTAYRPGH